MHRQNRLLLGRLHGHEAHRRPAHRLADRLGISRVVIVALDVSLDVLRWHQPDLMAQRRNLARPVMRRRARLYTDKTTRQRSEKAQDLRTADRLADQHHPARINAMNLKNVLGQINSNRRNLVHGWLPPLVFIDDTILALEMPSGGHPPHHFMNPAGTIACSSWLTLRRRVERCRPPAPMFIIPSHPRHNSFI
jgi:hypothetical protein